MREEQVVAVVGEHELLPPLGREVSVLISLGFAAFVMLAEVLKTLQCKAFEKQLGNENATLLHAP
eukprot:6161920-Amphidinium_carterae.1